MIVGQHIAEGIESHLVGTVFVSFDRSQITCTVIVEGHYLGDGEGQVWVEGNGGLLVMVMHKVLPVVLPVAYEIVGCSFGAFHNLCGQDKDATQVPGLAHECLVSFWAVKIVTFTIAIEDIDPGA